MNANHLFNKTKACLAKQSPTILAVIGAVGVVATAVTAVRATPRAIDLLDEARHQKWMDADCPTQYEKDYELTPVEMIQATWQCYVPSVLIGSATIVCIFGSNALNKRQQAALTSAYIFLEQSYKNYRSKVIELLGTETDKEIQSEIVKDKAKEEDISTPRSDEVLLFYEDHYGKFFERTMLEVQDAEYQLNRKLALEGEASLNDFFEFLGLNSCEIGDILGWSYETICDFSQSWIDFEHQLVETDDGMECRIITMVNQPVRDFA